MPSTQEKKLTCTILVLGWKFWAILMCLHTGLGWMLHQVKYVQLLLIKWNQVFDNKYVDTVMLAFAERFIECSFSTDQVCQFIRLSGYQNCATCSLFVAQSGLCLQVDGLDWVQITVFTWDRLEGWTSLAVYHIWQIAMSSQPGSARAVIFHQ